MKKHAALHIVLLIASGALLYYVHFIIPAIFVWTLATVLVLLAIFAPQTHRTVSELGVRLEKLVGSAIGTVLLTLTYYLIFWPGALWLRLTRKDVLTLKFPGSSDTNWVHRTGNDTRRELYPKQYSNPHGRVGPVDSSQ